MRWLKNMMLSALATTAMLSCEEAPKHPDTLTKGTIDISVDETFRPVIEEQLKVFDSSYPEAKINVHYKPEAECFKDYFDNKARIILVTRELTKDEKELCSQKKIWPTSEALAGDAIAVVTNNESPDSVLDLDALKGILTGAYKKKYTVVFDNQASSTVRYITDSLLKGGKLGSNVFAAKSDTDVISYVAKNPDALGFTGMSYVYANEDTSRAGTFISSVRVAAIKNDTDRQFYKPYQAYIALKSYPLTRKLFYVSAESYHGLGTGFANFLGSHRGQLIFLHDHFFPLKEQIVVRPVELNNKH
jgi:phosphate transport system substrate-binding protein